VAARKHVLLFIFLLLVTPVYASADVKPPAVPRKVVRQLDTASYVELARQWKKYIEETGESGEALLNLARAYDYSGEIEAAAAAAKRAVELAPDSPEALAFYGVVLSSWGDGETPDLEGALELFERCRAIAPDYEYGLTGLATVHLRKGDLWEADRVFETVFKERVFPVPLQDYAYNILVGLPEGAVIITWGDNDTYAPLALQAGMGLRKDVAVLNLSLLNLDKYSDAMFERYPVISPEDIPEWDQREARHKDVIRALLKQQKVPVYFVSAINFDYVGETPERTLEGFNLRTAKKGLTAEESAKLFLETYRLDSATDWSYPWSLTPSLRDMMMNYVSALIRLSEYDDLPKDIKGKLLAKALEISEFHEFDRLTPFIHRSMKDL
jgi:tetratricopeptide (TPR) repeat protein